MLKKIGIILFFVGATLVVAHCLIGGTAFADTRTQDGQPCPPECVTDSMEIVTWYPSPYNEYEELRLYPTQRDPGDCDNYKIGLMYYDHGGTPSFADDDKMKICKGTLLGWQEVGGGDSVLPNFTSSNKPACETSILGKMIFLTDKDGAYLCGASGWRPVSGYSYLIDYPNTGTYTFTVPNNVYDVEIEIWSAGGGGGGGGSCAGGGGGGGDGSDSRVNNLIIAYGGKGGAGGSTFVTGSGGLGGTSNGRVNIAGQQGTAGGSGGAGGYSSSPNLAKGGDAGGSGDSRYPAASGGGGGGGGYGRGVFSVSPNTSLTVAVGGGGSAGGGGGGTAGCSSCCGGQNGSSGNPGRVIIRY